MKIKTKLGEIEPIEIYDRYSDRVEDHNFRFFRNDSYLGVGDEGYEYLVHCIDREDI